MKAIRITIAAFLLIPLLASASVVDWKPVGSGTMRWTFFELYDIRLLTETGRYSADKFPQALEITYRRDIPSEKLVEATQDQWQHLGLTPKNQESWLQKLAALWPDIRKGDTLRFEVYPAGENLFFYNGTALGSVTDSDFSRAFLDIWLSPKTSEPSLRNRLIASKS
ncbi:MAG: chalcone isomerase family protein [Granulosicoccaceae bacterium]